MKEEKKPYLCPTAVVYTMAVEGGLLSGSDIIPEGDPGNNGGNTGGGSAGTGEYGETFSAPGFGGFGGNDDGSSGGGSGGDIWDDIGTY